MDTYHTVSEKCIYVDSQSMKLQEMPENIPTGDMPRTVLLSCSRFHTDRVNPGNRVKIVGILKTFNRGGQFQSTGSSVKTPIKMPYVQVLGI